MFPAGFTKQAAAAGLISAGLFVILFATGLGTALMLLPSLPLFMLGLHRSPRELAVACVTGYAAVLMATSFHSALFYGAFLLAPILLIAPASIMTERTVGAILADVAIYAALVIMATILHLAPEGGVTQLISTQMAQQLAEAEPQLRAAMDRLSGSLIVLVLGATGWWWVLLLYAHAALANWMLTSRGRALRPSLAITPFALPGWLLPLVAIAGLISLYGDGDFALAGKAGLVVLLLPYFLLGMSLAHEKVRTWPSRTPLLFALYFFTFFLVWPALIIAAVGVWQQCKTVAKKL